MKTIFIKAIIFIMALNVLRAQENFLGHVIQFTPLDRPARSLVQEEYKSALLKKYKPLFNNEDYLQEFTDEMVRYKIQYLNSNLEYENYDEIELYLHKIIEPLGFEQALGRPIEIKIVREPSLNAYVYEDGIIYVHIGLLAQVDSEAEIAAVLSHEMGHIAYQHSYKQFLNQKKYLRNQGNISVFSPGILTGIVASSVNAKNYSNRMVGQEEEADENAFKTIRQSRYNYSAFHTVFSKFIEIERKYKNMHSYSKPFSLFYVKTHPNSEKRIESAKKFALEISGKHDFLVDSISFSKLKRMAIDETINLYFEQLAYDECLEMAFREHLFYPKDQFYLFYVTECTRRLLAANPFYEEALFISGIYNVDFCQKQPVLTSKVVCTEGKMLSADKRVQYSIFNKLCGPILNLNETDVANIANQDLIQCDTVKFLTYTDAFQYFKALNRKLGYTLNNYLENETTISKPSLDSVLSGRGGKSNYYKFLPAIVNEYMQGKSTDGKPLWIIYDWNFLSQKRGLMTNQISINGAESYKGLMAYLEENKLLLAQRKDLDFDSYNKVSCYLSAASDRLKRYKSGRLKERKPLSYRISEAMPDIYFMLVKNNYSTVVFSAVDIKIEETEINGTSNRKTIWTVNNYIMDVRHNLIRCQAGNICAYSGPNILTFGPDIPIEQLYFDGILRALEEHKIN